MLPSPRCRILVYKLLPSSEACRNPVFPPEWSLNWHRGMTIAACDWLERTLKVSQTAHSLLESPFQGVANVLLPRILVLSLPFYKNEESTAAWVVGSFLQANMVSCGCILHILVRALGESGPISTARTPFGLCAAQPANTLNSSRFVLDQAAQELKNL